MKELKCLWRLLVLDFKLAFSKVPEDEPESEIYTGRRYITEKEIRERTEKILKDFK